MSITLKPGHDCGRVRVEIAHKGDGTKAVMFEQDKDDIVSMDFNEIDALIAYLTEQKERLQ